MKKIDIFLTVVGLFILLAIGGKILYPKEKAQPALPSSIDSMTRNGPGSPPPVSSPSKSTHK
jgi:hypothetical protein